MSLVNITNLYFEPNNCIDGCGKTTQIELLSKYLDNKNINNSVIREPGGTILSEKIRDILLDKNNNITFQSETLLFLAARAQLVYEIMNLDLKKNSLILCDRFIDSTVAYQGYGHDLNLDLIDKLNLFATDDATPVLTIIFDIEPIKAIKRIRKKSLDRMELRGEEYLTKVRNGYLNIFTKYPNRCKVINCDEKDINSINNEVIKLVKSIILEQNSDSF